MNCVGDRGADRVGAVVTSRNSTPLGMERCRRGSSFLMSRPVAMMLAPGWRCVDDDGRFSLIPAADARILQSLDDVGDVLQHDRRAAAIGDDDVAIGLRIGDLVVGVDRVGLPRAVERTFGRDVCADDGEAADPEPEPVRAEPREIGLDAHRRRCRPRPTAADPGPSRGAGRDQRVGEIAELAQRHGLGRQRQRQDRRIGRVHLGIDRRIGQVARQRRGRR